MWKHGKWKHFLKHVTYTLSCDVHSSIFYFSFSCIGEGNGNPLQCFCLENPRDRGAWWAAVSTVAQSRTRLKWPSSSSSSPLFFSLLPPLSSLLTVMVPHMVSPWCLKSAGVHVRFQPLWEGKKGKGAGIGKEVCSVIFPSSSGSNPLHLSFVYLG